MITEKRKKGKIQQGRALLSQDILKACTGKFKGAARAPWASGMSPDATLSLVRLPVWWHRGSLRAWSQGPTDRAGPQRGVLSLLTWLSVQINH